MKKKKNKKHILFVIYTAIYYFLRIIIFRMFEIKNR